MKIAIVGSRRRHNRKVQQQIFCIVEECMLDCGRKDEPFEVVSGGCMLGADIFARDAAHAYRVPYWEFPVDHSTPIEHKGEFAKRAYARNRLIAERADVIYAFVSADRTGGTENTIKHAKELGKTVFVIDGAGQIYLEHEGKADKTGAP